jgi:hypothetical protein
LPRRFFSHTATNFFFGTKASFDFHSDLCFALRLEAGFVFRNSARRFSCNASLLQSIRSSSQRFLLLAQLFLAGIETTAGCDRW